VYQGYYVGGKAVDPVNTAGYAKSAPAYGTFVEI